MEVIIVLRGPYDPEDSVGINESDHTCGTIHKGPYVEVKT